jgi:hypothetical protein
MAACTILPHESRLRGASGFVSDVGTGEDIGFQLKHHAIFELPFARATAQLVAREQSRKSAIFRRLAAVPVQFDLYQFPPECLLGLLLVPRLSVLNPWMASLGIAFRLFFNTRLLT